MNLVVLWAPGITLKGIHKRAGPIYICCTTVSIFLYSLVTNIALVLLTMEVKFYVLVCILVFLFSGLGSSIPIPTQTGYQFTSTLPGINARPSGKYTQWNLSIPSSLK